MSKISACLVVYNEAKNIQRCLASLLGVVDEIILVSDGDCQDETLDIAKKYSVKIFIRPHVGMMEAHLVFAIEQTSGDWLLRIDADEFLTTDLKNNLRLIVAEAEAQNISAVSFRWPDFDPASEKLIKSSARKTILFKKEKLYWVALPHLAWQTRGSILKSDFSLGHLIKQTPLASWLNTQKTWAKIQAEYLLKDFSELEVWQAERADWEKFYTFSRRRAKYLFLIPLKFFKAFSEEFFQDFNFRKASRQAIYNFLLAYYLYVFVHRR